MGDITDQINLAWRDFNTDGVPSSGDYDPVKSIIRATGPVIEESVAGIVQPYSDAAQTSALAAEAAAAINSVLDSFPMALPYEVIGIAGGIGTGSGGTPGHYVGGIATGTTFPGFEWSYDIGPDGKLLDYDAQNEGICANLITPTLTLPYGGISGATAPTATVQTIPVGRIFWAPSFDRTKLLCFFNNGGTLSQYPALPAQQLSISLNNAGGLQLIFPSSGFITINRFANTVTTSSAQSFLLTKDGTVAINANQNIVLPSGGGGTIYLYVLGGVLGTSTTSVPAGAYLVAFITPTTAENCFAYAPGTNVSYVNSANTALIVGSNGTSGGSAFGADLPTLVGGGVGAIGINLSTGMVTTTGGTYYVAHSLGFKQVTASQNVAITNFTNGASLQTIFVNMATGAIGGIQTGPVPANCLAIAYVFNQQLYPAASIPAGGTWPFALTSTAGAAIITDPKQTGYKPTAMIYSSGLLTVTMTSSTTGTISTTGTCFAGAQGAPSGSGLITIAAGQSVAFTMTGAGRFYVDGSGNLLYTNAGIPAGNFWPLIEMKFAPASGADASAITTSTGNVRFVDTTGVTTYIGTQPASGVAFSPASNRIVMPNDLWFVAGHSQPIYKGSITNIQDRTLLAGTKLLLDTGLDQDSPYISLGEISDIDPARIGASPMAVMTNADSANTYSVAMTAHVAPANAISGTSPKVLVIGNSLDMYGGIRALQDQLIALGATPQFVGTFAAGTNPSAVSGNLAGEGRGSWSLRSFTGRDSSAAGTAITYSQTATTTQYVNPFLRVATSTDKANNPTACYSFTSNTYKNKSYAEDNTLGTYYIFDFAAYLSACSVATPDVVLIQESTNSILYGGYSQANQVIENTQALTIIVNSIRAAAPSCKIVVVSGRPSNRKMTQPAQWYGNFLPFFEGVQATVKTLKATITGLSCVGTYAHASDEWGWPYTTTAFGGNSAETINAVTDDTHYSQTSAQTTGKKRVARVEAAAITCALAGV